MVHGHAGQGGFLPREAAAKRGRGPPPKSGLPDLGGIGCRTRPQPSSVAVEGAERRTTNRRVSAILGPSPALCAVPFPRFAAENSGRGVLEHARELPFQFLLNRLARLDDPRGAGE